MRPFDPKTQGWHLVFALDVDFPGWVVENKSPETAVHDAGDSRRYDPSY